LPLATLGPSACEQGAAPDCGRATDQTAKRLRQMRLIGEPAAQGDFRKRQIRLQQHLLSPLDTATTQMSQG